jgi:hypothetical protein
MTRLSGKAAYSIAVGAILLVLSAGPSLAQRDPVPCSAFSRNASGGWTVRAPVMLDLGGTLLAPMVGTIFAAGSTMHGIEMSDVLDRNCGNR